jgi:hypothetical protein
VGHDQIDITFFGHFQGSSGASPDMANPYTRILFELILQGPYDPRINGTDGTSHEDKALLRPAKAGYKEKETQQHR